MTKSFLFSLFCSSLFIFSARADDYLDSSAQREGLTFYCSFDSGINADQSSGDSKGELIGDVKGSFVPGLKNQGLLVGADAQGTNLRMVQYQALKNIDAKQGTVLFWFQPKDWGKFSAKFQHLVSAIGGSSVYCYKMTPSNIGIYEGKGRSKRFTRTLIDKWQDGQWHHFAAVWTADSWTLYIDGKRFGNFQRESEWSEKPWRRLCVGALNWKRSAMGGMTVIDELRIFNRPFLPGEIVNAYSEFGSRLPDAQNNLFSLRIGKSSARQDGRIESGEYAASGNGFQTLEEKYSQVQPKWHFGFDDRYLYAAMESEVAETPVAKVLLRDGTVYADDSVELDLQGADGVIHQIVVNTKNVIYDSRIQKQHSPEWNLKKMEIGSTIQNGIWTVELAIPLDELGKPRQDGSWGLNFGRALPAANSVSRGISLAPVRKRGFLDTERYGSLFLDPAVPCYVIWYKGNLNAGDVQLFAEVPADATVRTAYSAGDRLWFDDQIIPTNGQMTLSRKVMPNGMLTTEIRQGENLLYRARLTGRIPLPLKVQYVYTVPAEQKLHIVLKNENAQVGGAMIVQLKNRQTAAVIAEKRLPITDGVIFRDETWDISTVPAGDYDLCCTPISADGKAQGEAFIQIFRKPGASEAWRNNQIGVYPGEVPPPWIPIRSKDGQIDMLTQSYRFGDSMLPVWFGTHQENLLCRPAELLVNGRPVLGAKFSILKAAPDVVTARVEGKIDGLTLQADYRFEFDGMIWIRLLLNGQSFPLKSLKLEFPLRMEEGHLVHGNTGADTYKASIGRNGKLDDSIWNKNLYASPMFWVGGDHLGLFWFAENLKNWCNTKNTDSVEIFPNGKGERLVRLNLIDRPVTIHGEYPFEFGLQGSPVKPPANHHYVKRWRNYGQSTTYFDYHDPAPEFFTKQAYEQAYQRVAKQKEPYFYYCSSNGMSPYAPEWAWYGSEWTSNLIGAYMIEYQIRNQQERNRFVWTFACLKGKSFFDFKTWQIGRLITSPEYNLNTIYFDLVGPRLCDNVKHGCGWRDSRGGLWPTLNILGVREFHKRMYFLSKKKNPEFLHFLHITGRSKVLPVNAFADAVADGETFFGNEVVDKENYYSVFTPEMFRACYQTSMIGYDLVFIPQLVRAATMRRPDRVKLWRSNPAPPEMYRALRHFAGYALVHNVFIWAWDPWTREMIAKLKADQEKHFGTLRDLEFISYWEPKKPYSVASVNPPRTMVSVLKHENRAAMFIFNDTAEEQQITVSVDTGELLGSSGMEVRDFEPEYPSEKNGNRLIVNVPARFCLICFLSPKNR